MRYCRTLLALLCVAQFAFAQEEPAAPETDEPVELVALPADVAAEFAERVAAIEAQEAAVANLRGQFEQAEGLTADLLAGRVDALWAAMFRDTVRLAQDINEQHEGGFEVAAIATLIHDRLRVFPDESADALTRLRSGVVFPTDEMAPPELAITDQYLLRATEKLDFVLGSVVSYLEVADQLGIENEAVKDFVIEDLEESAANRSTFLQLALEDVTVLRAAAAALPTDTEVAARLSVHCDRIQIGRPKTPGRVAPTTDVLQPPFKPPLHSQQQSCSVFLSVARDLAAHDAPKSVALQSLFRSQ